ncbi:MAG: DUF6110 family protein [Ruthenibacterium sp.]
MRELVCFAGGVLFGTAGIKVLASKDAKKVYVQTAAAALRARDCVMDTVNKVQENAEDVLAEAKAVNEARAQQAQDAQEEEEVPAE